MEALLPLLLLLACPVGMGVAMWLAQRASGGQAAPPPADSPTGALHVPLEGEPPDAGSAARPPHLLCLDWRVLAGLAAVGVFVWLVAPRLVLPALVLLALLACPVSHYVMMRGLAGRSCHVPSRQLRSGGPGPD